MYTIDVPVISNLINRISDLSLDREYRTLCYYDLLDIQRSIYKNCRKDSEKTHAISVVVLYADIMLKTKSKFRIRSQKRYVMESIKTLL